jgi:hypothetical protein
MLAASAGDISRANAAGSMQVAAAAEDENSKKVPIPGEKSYWYRKQWAAAIEFMLNV